MEHNIYKSQSEKLNFALWVSPRFSFFFRKSIRGGHLQRLLLKISSKTIISSK